jgi:hypothetical protein
MKQKLFTILAALVMCVASGCAMPVSKIPSKAADELNVRTVDLRNPSKDAADSIQRGDFRFIAVRDLGIGTPGVQDQFVEIERTYGLRFIEETSDTISIANMEAAEEYATIYNLSLRRHLRVSGKWRFAP